jgi:DNA-binding MarR family transcriptional regulator
MSDPERPDRSSLLAELVEELAAHTPSDMLRAMRRWPRGPLSLVHLNVLIALSDAGPLPMRALAETLDVSQASTTGIVDRMEQRGLVERRRDDEDRRVIRVGLSAAGTQLVEALSTERRERLGRLLDLMTDDELDAFARGVRGMRRAREQFLAAEEEAAR